MAGDPSIKHGAASEFDGHLFVSGVNKNFGFERQETRSANPKAMGAGLGIRVDPETPAIGACGLAVR